MPAKRNRGHGDTIKSRGVQRRFDAGAIMADLTHGASSRSRSTIPTGLEKTEDYYYGRCIVGSEDVVTALQEKVPSAYPITSAGRIVIPLIYRHSASQLGPKTANHRLKLIQEAVPFATEDHIVAIRGIFYGRRRQSLAVGVTISPKDPGVQALEDSTHVVARISGGEASNYHRFLRFAETTDPDDVQLVTDVISETLLDHDASRQITLGPVELCSVLVKGSTSRQS